jgi:heme exporter protein C
MMNKLLTPLVVVTAAMLGYAPIAIANAPYESTMLLVQKIFYFHISTWMALSVAVTTCAVGSLLYLFKGNERADRVAFAAAELSVIYCTFGLISGSLWGRKAWGVWWQWDAKLTMAFMLEMIFLGYLIVRKYAGPGAEKLAAAMGVFGAATAPFIYKSADWWRTVHPQTSVMKTLGEKAPVMWNVVWFCGTAFVLLFVVLLIVRVELEERRAELDRLYLEAEA